MSQGLEPELVLLDLSTGEDESDLANNDLTFEAAINSRDWTIETLVSQMRKGRIDLNPRFQRRNAWLEDRRSKLIESVILGFPVPQIVIAETPNRPGHFVVLDGKQRLLAIRQFFADPNDPLDKDFDPIKLKSLEVRGDLVGMGIDDLAQQKPDLLAKIENYTLRTVSISDWSSYDMLLRLFIRLNTGSVALSPHELRQSLKPGLFIDWLDDKTITSTTLQGLLGNDKPDRRMADSELALRYLAFRQDEVRYRGNLKDFLDRVTEHFNAKWATEAENVESWFADLEHAIEFGVAKMGEGVFCRKWNSEKNRYERALNRAVFDVQVYAFSFKDVRESLSEHDRMTSLIDEFKDLCEQGSVFERAVSSTTKTPKAFLDRHSAWLGLLRGLDAPVPNLPTPLATEA